MSHSPGRHGLLDLYGCPPELLRNEGYLKTALEHTARHIGATVLESRFHTFGGESGVTGVLLLAESHLSIHTWPEHHFAALDIYLCSGDITRARRTIEAALRPAHSDWRAFPRGCSDKVLP